MTGPADREFAVLPRGYIRDRVTLMNWRTGLRALINPETGATFTEDEIARATQVGSRWWIEAEGIDQIGQLAQRNAIYLSDQGRLERASTEFLLNLHGREWGEAKLPATGGSGLAAVGGVVGTIVVGSTTVPDPSAYQCRDAAGKKYQVCTGGTIGSTGVLPCTLKAIDTGATTNPAVGATLTWMTKDPNMKPTCVVSSQFAGGTDLESDADFANRLAGVIRYKQAAGNDAHMRAWARKCSNEVEDAYIYPCALNAGSTVIALTAKRTTDAPGDRTPSATLLASATAYLVPPNSPIVPARAFVIVVPTQSVVSNMAIQLALQKGTEGGWADAAPFPTATATYPVILSVATQTSFIIQCDSDATLPGQVAGATLTAPNAPALMIWDESRSQFEELKVASVTDLLMNFYWVQLTQGPSFTLLPGQVISPYTTRHDVISETIGAYFDELGPGDLFNGATDPRGGRCVRFPRSSDERPYKIGQAIATRIIDDLGGSSADALISYMPVTDPGYPANITDGPKMLVCGKVGVYSL